MPQNTERSLETANAYAAGNIGNLDEAWTRRLVASVVDTESSGGNLRADNGFGYYGRYQAGAGWLVDAGLVNREKYEAAQAAAGLRPGDDWTWGERGGAQRFLNDPSNWNNGLSLQQYLGSAELQDRAFRTNSQATYQQAVQNGVLNADSEPNVVAGFLKARHLAGYNGALDALSGRTGPSDANGTSAGKYYHDIASNNDGFDRYFVPNFQRRTTTEVPNPLADGVLDRGDRGPKVEELQRALNARGFSTGGVDGDFGRNTENAVKAFQTQNNLQPVDGIVGPRTAAALGITLTEAQSQQPTAPTTPAPTTPTTPAPTTPTTPAPTPTTPPEPVPSPQPTQPARDIGMDIAETARSWAGRDFKPGQTERCQDFVNSVLNQTSPGLADRIGTTRQAQDGMESGELLASRFSGSDVARRVPVSEARPGDIVMFANTYGNYPPGTITHVGIYVGDGMMVDRPTANRPVEMRSINTFGEDNVVVYRPHAYGQTQSVDSPTTNATPTAPGQVPAGMYREGDSGEGVRALQEALRRNGAQIEADGRFGPRTEAAVMDFQTKNGLLADGIAGPQTIAKLNETLQQNQPTPAPAQPNTPTLTTPTAPTGETPAPTNPQQPSTTPAQPTTPTPPTAPSNETPTPSNPQAPSTTPAQPTTPMPTAPSNETPAPTNPQQPSTTPAQPTTPTPTPPTAPSNETPTPTNPQAPTAPTAPTPPTAPGAPTAAALQGEGVLVEGARGQDVARLQQQLNNLGYTGPDGKPLQANGTFDAATTHAVKAFERDAGQPQDGIVGPRTTEALNKAEQSLVSNPSHPDNAMYQQAQKALQGMPAGTFANEQERNNAAAALTHEAKVSGMTQIDSVVANRSGSGLIAVQGGVEDPNSRRVYVDMDQAKTQPVRESSQLMQDGVQPAQNAQNAQNQNQQRDNTQNQPANQQANPQQVNPQQQMDQQNREQTEQTRTAPAR